MRHDIRPRVNKTPTARTIVTASALKIMDRSKGIVHQAIRGPSSINEGSLWNQAPSVRAVSEFFDDLFRGSQDSKKSKNDHTNAASVDEGHFDSVGTLHLG